MNKSLKDRVEAALGQLKAAMEPVTASDVALASDSTVALVTG